MSRKHVRRENAVWAVARIIQSKHENLPVVYETRAANWRAVPTNESIRTYPNRADASERADTIATRYPGSRVFALPVYYADQDVMP